MKWLRPLGLVLATLITALSVGGGPLAAAESRASHDRALLRAGFVGASDLPSGWVVVKAEPSFHFSPRPACAPFTEPQERRAHSALRGRSRTFAPSAMDPSRIEDEVYVFKTTAAASDFIGVLRFAGPNDVGPAFADTNEGCLISAAALGIGMTNIDGVDHAQTQIAGTPVGPGDYERVGIGASVSRGDQHAEVGVEFIRAGRVVVFLRGQGEFGARADAVILSIYSRLARSHACNSACVPGPLN